MSSASRASLRQYGEWLLFRGLLRWLRRGDLKRAGERARRLAAVARWLMRDDWRWCLLNLEMVYGPGLTPAQRRQLANRVFEERFLTYLEGVRWDEVEVQVEGADHLREALARGRGAIACGVHLGSWEPAMEAVSRLARGAAAVYRPVDNPLSEREIRAIRQRRETRWIVKSDFQAMVRQLQDGGVLILFADLNAARGGLAVPFLGLTAMTPTGAARLALRCGSPVVPLIPRRVRPGHTIVRLGEIIDPQASQTEPAAHLLRCIHRAVEPWILEFAEQYQWYHPRWRTRPQGPAWSLDDPPGDLRALRDEPFAAVADRVRAILGEGPWD